MVVEIIGPGSTNCLVEASSDLLSWEPLGTFYAHCALPSRFPTNNLFWDPLVEPVLVRFYRASSSGRLDPDPYQLWSTNKPPRYRYHYERCGAFVLSTVSKVEGDVHVENGVIRSLENVTGTAELIRQSMTNAFMTIDGLFSMFGGFTGKATRRRSVIFDSEWGYPRWILLETTDAGGTPAPLGSHLVTQFTVE
jgi:hypothetical protein